MKKFIKIPVDYNELLFWVKNQDYENLYKTTNLIL